jgi:hypothetical protein
MAWTRVAFSQNLAGSTSDETARRSDGFECFLGKSEGRMDMSLKGVRLRFLPTADVLALASVVGFCVFEVQIRQTLLRRNWLHDRLGRDA